MCCSDAVRRNVLEIAPTISRGLCRLSAALSDIIVNRQHGTRGRPSTTLALPLSLRGQASLHCLAQASSGV